MTADPVVLQLVTAPEADAEVLFDFNDELTWPDHDSFNLGAPALLGDPGGVAAEYDYRTVSWQQVIGADDTYALRLHGHLARALLRDELYLRLQYSASSSALWLRCVRSAPGAQSLVNVFKDSAENHWLVDVSLVAEPFMLGEERSEEVLIPNAPLEGGLVAVLPDPGGDAPTPYKVSIRRQPSASAFLRPFLSVLPLRTDRSWPELAPGRPKPVYVEAEDGVLFNNAQVSVDTADDSRGAAVYLMAGLADNAGKTLQIQANLPVRHAGRYRVFARVTHQDDTGSIWAAGPNAITAPRRDLRFKIGWHLVDLGLFAFPAGNQPAEPGYTLAPDAGRVDIHARTGAMGNPQVFVDYLVAVPVDLPLDQAAPGSVCEFERTEETSTSGVLVINGEAGRVEQVGQGQHAPRTPIPVRGGFLHGVPGATNVLHFLPRRSDAYAEWMDTAPGKDSTTTITVLLFRWRPRYLYLAE